MMRALERVLVRIRRLPRPTGLGYSALILTVLLGGIAIGGGGPLLLLLFGLCLAALVLSLVMPVLNLRRLSVERVLPPNVYAGERFQVSARIASEGRSSDCFGVVLADGPEGPYASPGYALALRISPEEPTVVRYRVRIKQRGRHEVTTYRLSTRFPFGLFEYSVTGTTSSKILVFPRIGRFRADPLPGSRFSRLMTATETVNEKGQEEFRNLREYRPGDNPRLVSWRATAHHGTLMVKELEDDLTKRVTVFLESRCDRPDRKRYRLRLERTISFTATLLRLLARRRYWIQLFYFGPEPQQISAGRGGRKLNRVMERLATLEPTRDGGIHQLVRLAPDDALWTSMPVLIMPELSDRRLAAALERMPGRRPPVVFRTDGHWERSMFGFHDDGSGEIIE